MRKIRVPGLDRELNRLAVGSYEHLISRLETTLLSEGAKIFGSKGPTRIVGTFPGYAIVAAEDGRYARVKYDDAKGQIRILAHEDFKASPEPSQDSSFLKEEASRAVEEFAQGDVQSSLDRLRGLIPLVRRVDEEKILEVTLAFCNADRPWKRIFVEKSASIKRLILDEISSIHQDRLQSKFGSLYNGTTVKDGLESYRNLVLDNLKDVETRTDSLLSKVSKVSNELAALRVETEDMETVSGFNDFSRDLKADLIRTKSVLSTVRPRLSKVDVLARLHDTLAESFHDLELASCFVVKMFNRLQALPGAQSVTS